MKEVSRAGRALADHALARGVGSCGRFSLQEAHAEVEQLRFGSCCGGGFQSRDLVSLYRGASQRILGWLATPQGRCGRRREALITTSTFWWNAKVGLLKSDCVDY